jgi:hypothetical protein
VAIVVFWWLGAVRHRAHAAPSPQLEGIGGGGLIVVTIIVTATSSAARARALPGFRRGVRRRHHRRPDHGFVDHLSWRWIFTSTCRPASSRWW